MKSILLIFLGAVPALLIAACSDPAPIADPVQPDVAQSAGQPQIHRKNLPVAKVTPNQPVVKPGQITSIDIGRLFSMSQMNKIHLIDTRPPLYYRLGHIDGAVSFPLIKYGTFLPLKRPELDAALKQGKVIVAYCQNVNCPDAHKLASQLSKLGYPISIYTGGWEEWKHAGL